MLARHINSWHCNDIVSKPLSLHGHAWLFAKWAVWQLLTILVMGGDCLCKCETWNSEYFLQIPSRWSKTVILWLLSGQFSISWSWKHPRPTTGKHGFVCVFHYSPNCFIIPRTHSFGFLIRDQFHPIGKQFSDKLQSAVSRLPVSAQPAAMSQTGKINLITCARLHLPAWASVMLGFDSF